MIEGQPPTLISGCGVLGFGASAPRSFSTLLSNSLGTFHGRWALGACVPVCTCVYMGMQA